MGSSKLTFPQKIDLYDTFLVHIDNDDKYILFSNDMYHEIMYQKILDNTPKSFTFDMLINALNIGIKYFTEIDISVKIHTRIITWVKCLGKYSFTWNELLNKPDYGLELFKFRFWPYFKVDSKDWKDIAINVLNEYGYPSESDSKLNEDKLLTDYKTEYDISQKYNNFLGYTVLDPINYIDLSCIIERLELLNKINLKLLMFEAILRLMITPATCHIIKESAVMNLVKSLIVENYQYGKVFNHFMYYAMFILNHEDTVMFSQIKRNYRIIFNHMEALNMPSTNNFHIEMDPYIQQLTDETYLSNSCIYYYRCERHINSIETFERRLYLITGGALANIPLHKYKAAVSGSILIPCITTVALENEFKGIRFNTERKIECIRFNKNQNKTYIYTYNDDLYKSPEDNKSPDDNKLSVTEMDFMSFVEYYFASYHSLTDKDFVANVLKKQDIASPVLTKFLIEKLNITPSTDIPLKPNCNLLTDIDISISTDSYTTFKEIAQLLYSHIKKNCMHIGEIWIEKVVTVGSFKYKIYGPGLIRPIDLFKIPYGPEKMVKKFHCPIVRSWYDGSNAVVDDVFKHSEEIDKYWIDKAPVDHSYVLNPVEPVVCKNLYYIGLNMIQSSLITSLSGVNGNYKWFFNSKPCVEVILRYAQRGWSFICNIREIAALKEYMKSEPRWACFIADGIDMCGVVGKDHAFFSPCLYNAGIRYTLREFKKKITNTYSKSMSVGLANGKTEYDVDLSVKNNNKINMPDVNKINLFAEYINGNESDEYSDDEL